MSSVSSHDKVEALTKQHAKVTKQLEGLDDRRAQLRKVHAPKGQPRDLHGKLVLEGIDQRAAACLRDLDEASRALKELDDE
jgi:hypothetical protein